MKERAEGTKSWATRELGATAGIVDHRHLLRCGKATVRVHYQGSGWSSSITKITVSAFSLDHSEILQVNYKILGDIYDSPMKSDLKNNILQSSLHFLN